jgi:hypothetical protein
VKPSLSRLPSPALVIACVALFVSLGGVSYGLVTGSVDSREIKNNSVRSVDVRNNNLRSKDVRNNTLRTFDIRNNEVRGFDIRNSTIQGRDVAFDTLTGQDVSESSLGKVPSATTADTATTAGTANSVATLRIVAPTSVAEGAPAVTLVSHGPLTLTGACEADGPNTEAKLRVQTTEAGSAAGGTTDAPGAPAAPPVSAYNPTIAPGDGAVSIVELPDVPAGGRTIGEGTVFASAPSAKAFTGVLGLHADAAANSCLFHGHVALEG